VARALRCPRSAVRVVPAGPLANRAAGFSLRNVEAGCEPRPCAETATARRAAARGWSEGFSEFTVRNVIQRWMFPELSWASSQDERRAIWRAVTRSGGNDPRWLLAIVVMVGTVFSVGLLARMTQPYLPNGFVREACWFCVVGHRIGCRRGTDERRNEAPTPAAYARGVGAAGAPDLRRVRIRRAGTGCPEVPGVRHADFANRREARHVSAR